MSSVAPQNNGQESDHGNKFDQKGNVTFSVELALVILGYIAMDYPGVYLLTEDGNTMLKCLSKARINPTMVPRMPCVCRVHTCTRVFCS